ncbi:MAG: NADH-quinone oxidoreductase subunit H, partial [Planctomycetota bacterium]|nr:NADH-quinone oxidoreductase subunit H [Planctomycetota bacterium]
TGSSDVVTWPIAILRILVLVGKTLGVIVFFMMVRWSWPRFRFDQLMALAWKVMLPLGLVNLVLVACLTEYRSAIGVYFGTDSIWPLLIISWVVTLIAWIVAGINAPLATDNRPRQGLRPLDAESRLSH